MSKNLRQKAKNVLKVFKNSNAQSPLLIPMIVGLLAVPIQKARSLPMRKKVFAFFIATVMIVSGFVVITYTREAKGNIGSATTITVSSSFEWAYAGFIRTGAGVYAENMSYAHATYNDGYNCDYLFWVNESNSTGGVVHPDDYSGGTSNHGGGSIAFSSNGTLWYTYGGYFSICPADLLMSDSPYDHSSWIEKLDNYDTGSGCSPAVEVSQNDSIQLFYRNGPNDISSTGVQFRRYDAATMTENINIELFDGQLYDGEDLCPTYLWSTFDSRRNCTFMTFAYKWDGPSERWGSAPFAYSDDNGTTWRMANGTVYSAPIEYVDADIPDDNIASGYGAYSAGATSGMTPDGTPFMVIPHVDTGGGPQYGYFWRYSDGSWSTTNLTGELKYQSALHSFVTENTVGVLYVEDASNMSVKVRYSTDNGGTWSDPETVLTDDMSGAEHINGIRACMPKTIEDDTVRFFYSLNDGTDLFSNAVKWAKFSIISFPVLNVSGLTSNRLTWSGNAEDTVWCNTTGDGNETLNISISPSGTNIQEIKVYISDLNDTSAWINASNISVQFSSDNTTWGSNARAYEDGGSNISINSTLWTTANGCYGTDPFPISSDDNIYARFKLAIPAGQSADTYWSASSTAWKVYILG